MLELRPVCLRRLITPSLLAAAQARTDDLLVQLIDAKQRWQFAIKDQDARYRQVLELKAEYAEWRGLVEALDEALHTPNPDAKQSLALSPGAARLFEDLERDTRTAAAG